MNTAPKLWVKVAAHALAVAASLAVFLAYTRPEFMVEMANQVWACF
jgi:hypothetical protein